MNHHKKALEKTEAEKIISRLFDENVIPKDSLATLNSFDSIIQNVFPSSAKQKFLLSKKIKTLSGELTDKRKERRLGYMNAPENLSEYVNYFSWWNIIYLTRLFSNLGENFFPLNDDDVCVDIGSGPLTLVIAFWLSFPHLREKKLNWYCIDISQNALSLGENLYLSVAAKNPPLKKDAPPHWNIIRIKGTLGEKIKERAKLVTSANMFNELIERNNLSEEKFITQYATQLLSYANTNANIFIFESGVPKHARIISLLRDYFIEKKFTIISPCPHSKKCPMNGYKAKRGGKNKWCNFTFSTENAPKHLREISKDSGFLKERASASFLLASNFICKETEYSKCQTCDNTTKLNTAKSNTVQGANFIPIRIASEKILLPRRKTGYYACSELGLTLALNNSNSVIENGDELCVKISDLKNLPHDKKTQSPIVAF